MARRLSVSRMTGSLAYDRLTGEGFRALRLGAGTFVSDHASSVGPRVKVAEGVSSARPIWNSVDVKLVRQVFASVAEFDFRPGVLDSACIRALRPQSVGFYCRRRRRAVSPVDVGCVSRDTRVSTSGLQT